MFHGEFLNSLGAFSFLTLPVIGMFQMQISTGRYCSIGGGLRIPGNNHPMEALSSSPILYDPVTSWVQAYVEDEGLDDFPYVTRQRGKGAPEVANDVWLGSDVTLNHGVRIGNGAIVAAHSVVTRDVPDYAIVGGNPARVIRYRFPEEIIRELLSIEPWRYSVKDLRQFNLGDMASFIRQFRGAEASLQPWEPPEGAALASLPGPAWGVAAQDHPAIKASGTGFGISGRANSASICSALGAPAASRIRPGAIPWPARPPRAPAAPGRIGSPRHGPPTIEPAPMHTPRITRASCAIHTCGSTTMLRGVLRTARSRRSIMPWPSARSSRMPQDSMQSSPRMRDVPVPSSQRLTPPAVVPRPMNSPASVRPQHRARGAAGRAGLAADHGVAVAFELEGATQDLPLPGDEDGVVARAVQHEAETEPGDVRLDDDAVVHARTRVDLDATLLQPRGGIRSGAGRARAGPEGWHRIARGADQPRLAEGRPLPQEGQDGTGVGPIGHRLSQVLCGDFDHRSLRKSWPED